MPKTTPLSQVKLKQAKPAAVPFKLYDGGGLYVEVHPNGSKYWRLKYRINGKEKKLALGVFPEVSLAEARDRRDDARRLLRDGIDPMAQKQSKKRAAILNAENNFETLAREWHDKYRQRWTPDHAARILGSLERDVFPYVGKRPIAEIDTPEVITVLRRVEDRDALDVAKRIRQRMAAVFAYAKQTGRVRDNPARDLDGVIKTRKQQHRLALKQDDLPEFLAALKNYGGDIVTRLALQFMLLTFVRTKELLGAKWTEIDWKSKIWRIPAERMKVREPHIVPLSPQAIAILKQIKPLTGDDDYIFASRTGKTLSTGTMIYAVYRMGFHSRATVHGLRGTASTILNENGFNPDVIERQLAHRPGNEVRAAYNQAEYLPERHKMMKWWGDYVEKVALAKILKLTKKVA